MRRRLPWQTRSAPSPRQRDLASLLVLGAAVCALVPQVVLLGKLPDNLDFWVQEYVQLGVLHRWLRAGELPLWNGQLAAGTPHLADPQSAVLYPLTTLPLLVLGPAAVARLSIPLHHFLAGAFTYGYARQFGRSRAAATAAGLAYALAPHFAPLGNATYLQQSAVWAPAILWALERGFARRALCPFAAAGLLWALQLLRGYPQTWYLTGALAAAYCALRLVRAAVPRGFWGRFVAGPPAPGAGAPGYTEAKDAEAPSRWTPSL
jgi:hypothetical protein